MGEKANDDFSGGRCFNRDLDKILRSSLGAVVQLCLEVGLSRTPSQSKRLLQMRSGEEGGWQFQAKGIAFATAGR